MPNFDDMRRRPDDFDSRMDAIDKRMGFDSRVRQAQRRKQDEQAAGCLMLVFLACGAVSGAVTVGLIWLLTVIF